MGISGTHASVWQATAPTQQYPTLAENMAVDVAIVDRDNQGNVHTFSPVCTHVHCIVTWNTAEKTWDCPCHGGRFDAMGFVLNGPPVMDLEPGPPDVNRYPVTHVIHRWHTYCYIQRA